METVNLITAEQFGKRLTDLVLRSGMSEFPNDYNAQLILLKSVALTLERSRVYTEKEINALLTGWLEEFGTGLTREDFGSLRRRMVDAGFLLRTPDCSRYQVSPTGPRRPIFAEAVDQVDVREVIRSGREEIARRKQAYLEKAGG